MDIVKERARLALIRRINNYHSRILISDLVEDTVNELWNIFENNLLFGELDGKKINKSKGKKNFKRQNNSREEIDCKTDKVLWCKGKEVIDH